MDWLSIVLTLLVFIGIIIYVIQPLFQPRALSETNGESREQLEQQKRVIYQQIKELEMDRELENLSQADYLKQRDLLKKQAADSIRRIKDESPGNQN